MTRTRRRALPLQLLAPAALLLALGWIWAGSAGAAITSFTLSPTSGPPGTVVNISGAGCSPGLTVSSSSDYVAVSGPTKQASMRIPVRANGSWHGSFTVSANATAGTSPLGAPVLALCVSDGLPSITTVYTPQTFTITAAPTTTTPRTTNPTTPTPTTHRPGSTTPPTRRNAPPPGGTTSTAPVSGGPPPAAPGGSSGGSSGRECRRNRCTLGHGRPRSRKAASNQGRYRPGGECGRSRRRPEQPQTAGSDARPRRRTRVARLAPDRRPHRGHGWRRHLVAPIARARARPGRSRTDGARNRRVRNSISLRSRIARNSVLIAVVGAIAGSSLFFAVRSDVDKLDRERVDQSAAQALLGVQHLTASVDQILGTANGAVATSFVATGRVDPKQFTAALRPDVDASSTLAGIALIADARYAACHRPRRHHAAPDRERRATRAERGRRVGVERHACRLPAQRAHVRPRVRGRRRARNRGRVPRSGAARDCSIERRVFAWSLGAPTRTWCSGTPRTPEIRSPRTSPFRSAEWTSCSWWLSRTGRRDSPGSRSPPSSCSSASPSRCSHSPRASSWPGAAPRFAISVTRTASSTKRWNASAPSPPNCGRRRNGSARSCATHPTSSSCSTSTPVRARYSTVPTSSATRSKR